MDLGRGQMRVLNAVSCLPAADGMLRCTHRMLFAFPLLWAAGAVSALLYAQDRGIPWATALAVLPAFLLEVTLYFTMGVERLRLRLEKLPPSGVAVALVAAAVAPYALASLLLRNFSDLK